MARGCLGWRVSVGVRNRCLGPGDTEDADGSFRFVRIILTNYFLFPVGSPQVFICELTCWSKHLFQSVAKDGMRAAQLQSNPNKYLLSYWNALLSKFAGRVEISVACLFSRIAVKVIAHCLACYSGSCGVALWGVSWKAHLRVALATAASELLSLLMLSFCGRFTVVTHWSVGQEGELKAGVSFHKGLSSFLWEGLKLMMVKWSRLFPVRMCFTGALKECNQVSDWSWSVVFFCFNAC